MPGPPLGPSYLITTTSPLLTTPSAIPLFASYSLSNTLAGPSKKSPSFPVIFATDPPEAILPFKILMCPESFIGLFKGLIISWSLDNPLRLFKFSLIVFPVTVKQSPSIILFSNINFKTAGTPPTL